jgi:N-acyl amino acid synthase of PEP-CTERM/exosortase system
MSLAPAIDAFKRSDQSKGAENGGTAALFNRYLSVVRADSDELIDQVYRLRFQVYCVERGFEDPAQYPDGREIDADDARSLHSLLIDRITGQAVGTVRLILPSYGDELPLFGVLGCSRAASELPAATTAEVSRFAVAKAFRRRFEKRWCLQSGCASIGGRGPILQLLTFGLIQAVAIMSAFGGVTHIVGMMEPALLRLLERLGIAFHPLGGLVEYHGSRQPGWAVMRHLIANIKKHHPELGQIISSPDGGKWQSAQPFLQCA